MSVLVKLSTSGQNLRVTAVSFAEKSSVECYLLLFFLLAFFLVFDAHFRLICLFLVASILPFGHRFNPPNIKNNRNERAVSDECFYQTTKAQEHK